MVSDFLVKKNLTLNKIFSSYDEPGIRSSFVVSIQHHNSYHAISNMPLYNIVPVDDEYVISGFERTPYVQTYLIAFLISDFDFIEDVDEEGIPHRIFSTPEDIEDGFGDLALNVSRSLLDGFADYLQINYSLPKMDQAAIPDFAAGAMENWGLVTYAEPYLLFSENSSTTRDREYVIATISHEFVVSGCLSKDIFGYCSSVVINCLSATCSVYFSTNGSEISSAPHGGASFG